MTPLNSSASGVSSERPIVCYVLAYSNPEYVRTVSILRALKSQSYSVVEVINSSSGPWRYGQVLAQLVRARVRHRPDMYILGFRGHEIYWPVRALTMGRPLVFDCLLSATESLVAERKFGRAGQLAGAVLRPIERLILRSASAVLTDTEQHRQLLSERFAIPAAKVHAIPIGAFQDDLLPRASGPGFRLLFYATMIPLHGMDVVREAIQALEHDDVVWRVIGGQPQEMPPRIDHAAWVELSDIVNVEIPIASLGMGGPFGGTEQASRVVTGKTVQFLAGGLPVLVARTPAHQSAGFVDRVNCVMCTPGDAQSMLDSIQWAMKNPEALAVIGEEGRKLYDRNFSDAALGSALTEALTAL